MWSKRRKKDEELTGNDSISQIPGVGARYVARLQLHGVTTIGQFAAMAANDFLVCATSTGFDRW